MHVPGSRLGNDHAAPKSTTPEIYFSFPEAQRGHALDNFTDSVRKKFSGGFNKILIKIKEKKNE